jgi:hypothetical protein
MVDIFFIWQAIKVIDQMLLKSYAKRSGKLFLGLDRSEQGARLWGDGPRYSSLSAPATMHHVMAHDRL